MDSKFSLPRSSGRPKKPKSAIENPKRTTSSLTVQKHAQRQLFNKALQFHVERNDVIIIRWIQDNVYSISDPPHVDISFSFYAKNRFNGQLTNGERLKCLYSGDGKAYVAEFVGCFATRSDAEDRKTVLTKASAPTCANARVLSEMTKSGRKARVKSSGAPVTFAALELPTSQKPFHEMTFFDKRKFMAMKNNFVALLTQAPPDKNSLVGPAYLNVSDSASEHLPKETAPYVPEAIQDAIELSVATTYLAETAEMDDYALQDLHGSGSTQQQPVMKNYGDTMANAPSSAGGISDGTIDRGAFEDRHPSSVVTLLEYQYRPVPMNYCIFGKKDEQPGFRQREVSTAGVPKDDDYIMLRSNKTDRQFLLKNPLRVPRNSVLLNDTKSFWNFEIPGWDRLLLHNSYQGVYVDTGVVELHRLFLIRNIPSTLYVWHLMARMLGGNAGLLRLASVVEMVKKDYAVEKAPYGVYEIVLGRTFFRAIEHKVTCLGKGMRAIAETANESAGMEVLTTTAPEIPCSYPSFLCGKMDDWKRTCAKKELRALNVGVPEA